jgi:hypothetical protein
VHPTAHEGLVPAATAGSTTSRRGEVPSSRGQDRDSSVHCQAKKNIAVNLCFQSNYSNPSSSILLVSMTPSCPSANSSLSYGINADPSQLFLNCQRCIWVLRQLLQCLATSVKQGVVLSAARQRRRPCIVPWNSPSPSYLRHCLWVRRPAASSPTS